MKGIMQIYISTFTSISTRSVLSLVAGANLSLRLGLRVFDIPDLARIRLVDHTPVLATFFALEFTSDTISHIGWLVYSDNTSRLPFTSPASNCNLGAHC
jgi:hypothetical protein